MSPRLHLSSVAVVAAAFLGLGSGCQEPVKQVDGHDVTATKHVNGKTVNFIKDDESARQETVEQAKDLKKTADQVQFTPDEQAAHK
ncbi:MAG TPA: hypothetical protein VGM73_14715 [Candidatus Didemnitutus sp.]|jgi:hypothetical protein